MNQYLKSSVKVMAVMMAFSAPAFAGSDVSKDVKVASTAKVQGTDALKGFTVGVDVAYNHTDVRHEQQPVRMSNFTGGAVTDDESTQLNQSRCCVDPSINIGYSFFKDKFYAGIAGDFSFGKKSEATHDISDSGAVKAKTEIEKISGGVKLKAGCYSECLKTVFYGIAGVKWRNASFKVVLNDAEGSKAKVNTPFYVLGVGMERPIRNKLSFSAEFEHAWRNSTEATTLGEGSADIKQRLRENTLKLGIKYHI